MAWSWLHERDGRLLARGLWWGQPQNQHPISLDCLWVDPSIEDPSRVAGGLIEAAHASFVDTGMERLPDLILTLPVDWSSDASAVDAVAWRKEAAISAGLTERIERLSYAWTHHSPKPPHSSRLTFTPADDAAFLDVFTEVAQGSLDLNTQADLAELGPRGQAEDDLSFYLSLSGERGMWRLAHDADGVRVGFIIPSRSAYDASVSYLGVVPAHRGHGLVDDLLAEITIMHVENGAPRITGTTDTTNAPMAAAFHRAGYDLTRARLVVGPHPAYPLGLP